MDTILRITDLYKSFPAPFAGQVHGKKGLTADVLDGIRMELERGSVAAILGTNGSGKSTLFNILSGLIKADKGQIEYSSADKRYDLSIIPSYRRASMGITRLFQDSNIFPNLSVLDNMLIADNHRMGEEAWDLFIRPRAVKRAEAKRTAKAQEILRRFTGMRETLWDGHNQPAGSLSLGQQRLLGFARLFMNEKADLFLLDEPSAGVNRGIQEQMGSMIRELTTQGKTVLMIEHNIRFAEQHARDGFYLQEGRVLLKGRLEELVKDPFIVKNYLGNHA